MTLKELYDANVNIMQYFREKNNVENNTLNSILTSYDLQAGSYIQNWEENGMGDNYHINGERVELSSKDFKDKFSVCLAERLNRYDFSTVLEAGAGEATTLNFVAEKLNNKNAKFYGFDLAPSRVMQAQRFMSAQHNEADLIAANLFQTPYPDNAFDIIYTVHALEPNTNKVKEIVEELYRITNKYLVLVEPSYELGNEATRANIDKHKYIKNLKATIDNLGYKILEYELFPVGTYANQPAIMVIEKNGKAENSKAVNYVCPVCHKELISRDGNYFCEDCMVVYPVLKNVPLLTKENAILFTQYLD